jgi:hypothetical protein
VPIGYPRGRSNSPYVIHNFTFISTQLVEYIIIIKIEKSQSHILARKSTTVNAS